MSLLSTEYMATLLSAVLSYLCYAVVILFLSIVTVYTCIRPKHVDESVPGPKRIPWLGVTFGDESDVYLASDFTWSKWPTLSILLSKQYDFQTWGGPTLNIGFGGAFFNIVSPKCLQYILRDHFENYVKGQVARKCFAELLGTGIFTADGDVWKFHRKIVTAILTREVVTKQAFPLLVEKLRNVTEILRDTTSTIDFQDLCYRMTMDVFCIMAFGVELDSVENDSKYTAFLQAFTELQYLSHVSISTVFEICRCLFSQISPNFSRFTATIQ